MTDVYKSIFGEWYDRLVPVILSPEFQKLGATIANLRKVQSVFPARENVFRCFKETNPSSLLCVIWGMDPYPTKNVADGLAFSTSDSNPTPQSLRKIHKAIEEDIYHGLNLEQSNDLSYLAKQGVLLYNSALTVAEGLPGSHQEHWNWFSHELVDVLNNLEYQIPVISMGKVAQGFTKNLSQPVINVEHPAAAVYHGGIWKHENCFQKANEIIAHYYGPYTTIKW